jgi:hypothetical protein
MEKGAFNVSKKQLQSRLHCSDWISFTTAYSFDPPSTGILAPVTQRAPSEARNAITSATSSGLPILFSACMLRERLRSSSVFVKLDISVSMMPDATAFTRMPRGPNSAPRSHLDR